MKKKPKPQPTTKHGSTNLTSNITKPDAKQSNSNQQPTGSSDSNDDLTLIKKIQNAPKSTLDKHSRQGRMGEYEYDLIRDPNGWLDCVVIHEAQILLRQINQNITTLGPVRQFDIMTDCWIQLLHVNNNHWVCLTSIDCPHGYVIVLDSLFSPVSREL